MTETQMLVLELGGKGYSCAQMVILGGLRLLGEENPQLVRAMAGLAQGGGCSGELCGALSGGLCLLGLYLGKGEDGERPDPKLPPLLDELVEWFRAVADAGASVRCDAILGRAACAQGQGMDPQRCGALVAEVWDKVIQLLLENGVDPANPER